MNEQKLLKISPDKLKAFNSVLLDPNSQVMKDFFAVVARYGTPAEINRKHRAARKMENLFKIVQERNPDAVKDLNWLIEQRDNGAFIPVTDYRRKVLGAAADKTKFKDKYAVTLEVSALQYFPWIRPMAETAIAGKTLVPGRFIAVRKMKESETDGDLPAIVAALDIIGASFVENSRHQRHRRLEPAPRRSCHDHGVLRRHWPAQRTRASMAGRVPLLLHKLRCPARA